MEDKEIFVETGNKSYHVYYKDIVGKSKLHKRYPFKYSVYEGYFYKVMDEDGVYISLSSEITKKVIEEAKRSFIEEIKDYSK